MKTNVQFWDKIAEKYARMPVEDVPAYQRKLAVTKARLSDSDLILDLGCGTGSLALELAPCVSRVHAVDVSSEMIKIGRGKAADAQIQNVTFHQSAVTELPQFEPGSLDGVCAYSILHLVEDRAGLLQQVMKVLKPGGFFISSTVCLRGSWVPYGVILPVMRWLGKAPSVHILGVEQLLDEIRAAGFGDAALQDVGAKPSIAFVVASKPG